MAKLYVTIHAGWSLAVENNSMARVAVSACGVTKHTQLCKADDSPKNRPLNPALKGVPHTGITRARNAQTASGAPTRLLVEEG